MTNSSRFGLTPSDQITVERVVDDVLAEEDLQIGPKFLRIQERDVLGVLPQQFD